MNEFYAADPVVCRSASDLKFLLHCFGPYTGRYLASYPGNWSAEVERQLAGLGDVEAARVQTLLRRAREATALVARARLPWNPVQDWITNATPMHRSLPRIFDALIATEAIPPSIHAIHELELPPTAEERIVAIASEYARIARTLLLVSPEIAFVDPYLNPVKRQSFTVMRALIAVAAKGKARKISLWARAACVTSATKTDLQQSLSDLAAQSSLKPGREIEMLLIEDESKKTKMHGRYILSIKGGVRLDQGFQTLPAGRRVDVGPVGRSTHNELLDIFFDGKHDMRVVDRISVKT